MLQPEPQGNLIDFAAFIYIFLPEWPYVTSNNMAF